MYENVSSGFSVETHRADCVEMENGVRTCTKCGKAAVIKKPDEIILLSQDVLYVWNEVRVIRR